MSEILKITGLTKRYKKVTAVNQLNLTINKGDVFGFLGPNGSGKTTTLGMILGVINASEGKYSWFGDGDGNKLRLKIGSILEKPNFYPGLSGQKNLELTCKIKGVDRERISEVLKQVSLFPRKDDNFKTYSLGMKQRLAIAAALLNDPEVLIFDEPTNGLDPQGIAEIRELIIDIAKSGKTIILASHLLDEVQKVCTSFIILKEGNLIHHGNVENDFEAHQLVEIGSQNLAELASCLEHFEGYISQEKKGNKILVKIEKAATIHNMSRFLADKKVYVEHLVLIKKSLEDQFIEILGQN